MNSISRFLMRAQGQNGEFNCRFLPNGESEFNGSWPGVRPVMPTCRLRACCSARGREGAGPACAACWWRTSPPGRSTGICYSASSAPVSWQAEFNRVSMYSILLQLSTVYVGLLKLGTVYVRALATKSLRYMRCGLHAWLWVCGRNICRDLRTRARTALLGPACSCTSHW